MTQQQCVELLESHGIKPTANRIVVLKALADAERPMTLTDMEYAILSIDKSGVFRALTLFRSHHLVHTFDDGVGGTLYELCHSHNSHEDDDLHVHFFCERCHRTFCLDDIPLPVIPLPPGFFMTTATYTVKGICPHCGSL
jgi:Fur family ferric uptake transcriptional regulator